MHFWTPHPLPLPSLLIQACANYDSPIHPPRSHHQPQEWREQHQRMLRPEHGDLFSSSWRTHKSLLFRANRARMIQQFRLARNSIGMRGAGRGNQDHSLPFDKPRRLRRRTTGGPCVGVYRLSRKTQCYLLQRCLSALTKTQCYLLQELWEAGDIFPLITLHKCAHLLGPTAACIERGG